MSVVQTPLGYQKFAYIELDVFTRILASQFWDNEEVRVSKPSAYTDGYEYIAVADSGSSPTEPVWSCVRCTWVNNKRTRIQFRKNLSWADRSEGWL